MSRLEKGSSAIRSFTEDGFQYIDTVVKFFGSTVALFVLSIYSGFVALGMGVICFLIIFGLINALFNIIKR